MTGIKWVANGFDGLENFAAVPCEAAAPSAGEVSIRVTASGVNPADLKHVRRQSDPAVLPIPIGYEIAGVVTAVGADTEIGSGDVAVGDRVAAFRVAGGYASETTVPASKAFALAESVPDDQAAALLLAGCTAADMLHRSGAASGDTILVHGASGAVGAILLQLARIAGVRVIGTCGPQRFEAVTRFGGIPVAYGPGLADRVRQAVGGPVVAALDAAGGTEATEVSLELVQDRSRIITAVEHQAAADRGFIAVSGMAPDSVAYRDGVRGELLGLLAAGELTVPIARTFPLSEAVEALRLVASGHAGGKVVLLPG
ncbi:quinone oxidoreductase family protein [Gordonia neofelifaecis]|uniref:Alcohol dehydrogenase GroES domain-containing protein n=1 Tax=Gordonia neofelifaecis NRRL B-59395 TaxID=644548 RepID=F1YL55_9ACTN|nr:NADP-dependent oxidoreductase [Gordonia neofelifaecis]EGD54515.1 alcohol dehydrogenase GroES domain-containing protein [Gordonia neofelifaecis NRRL B-59395]